MAAKIVAAKAMAAKTAARKKKSAGPALQAIAGLASETTPVDRLIHERLRLGIVSALAVNEALSFNELKGLLKTTDGNLSVHARKLEEAGYITCTKGYDGRVPRTEYSLTTQGRRSLDRYLKHMEALIIAMKK